MMLMKVSPPVATSLSQTFCCMGYLGPLKPHGPSFGSEWWPPARIRSPCRACQNTDCLASAPQFLICWVWAMAWEFAFLINSKVLLVLLALRPHVESCWNWLCYPLTYFFGGFIKVNFLVSWGYNQKGMPLVGGSFIFTNCNYLKPKKTVMNTSEPTLLLTNVSRFPYRWQ